MELKTVHVTQPVYFNAAVTLLLGKTVACGISIIVAVMRRMRGGVTPSRRLNAFHVAVLLMWFAYAGAVALRWSAGMYTVREHERMTGKPSLAVREAIHDELQFAVIFGLGCAAIGLLSMLAWRGFGPMRRKS